MASSSTRRASMLHVLLDWILGDPHDPQEDVYHREQARRLLSGVHAIRLIRSHEQELLDAFRQSCHPHDAAPHVFLQACYVGSLPLVELLLPICGMDIRDANRETPLMRAAVGRHVEVVRFLLAEAPDHAIGGTTQLLQCAVRGGSEELLELLIQTSSQEFEWNSTLDQGDTLLRTAIASDQVNVAAVLLAHGASGLDNTRVIGLVRSLAMARLVYANGADFSGDAGREAVLHAVRQGDTPLVQFLLQHGADVRETQYANTSCVHEASLLGKRDIIQLFVATGVDVDLRLQNGGTPLHQAAAGGRPDVVRLLLEAGADLHARDREGKNAVYLASQSPEVRAILRRARYENIVF